MGLLCVRDGAVEEEISCKGEEGRYFLVGFSVDGELVQESLCSEL